MKGEIFRNQINDLIIHTYVSPEETFLVTSQIIETSTSVFIVDTQFYLEYAEEVLKFAKSLNKPIVAVIISHSHPDHFIGAEVFKKHTIVSYVEICKDIDLIDEQILKNISNFHCNKTSLEKVVPKPELKLGLQKLGGIMINVSLLKNAECENQILIELPDYNVIVAQDLAYNDVHLFLGDNNIEDWLKNNNQIINSNAFNLVLCGHGEPASLSAITKTNDYLNKAKQIIGTEKDTTKIKSFLVNNFPDYRGENLIDISNDFLLHGDHLV